MVNPHVEKIEQQPNGTGGVKLALSVLLTGFEKDESVTITGYATQSSGNLVTLFDTQKVDSVGFDGVANLTVYVTPPAQFKPEEEITIVISAAKVWATVLKNDGTTTWNAEYYPGAPGPGGQVSTWG
jgi:hypothetical protein